MWYAHEVAGGRAAGFAADDDAVAIDQHFLDVPLQVGDQPAKADHLPDKLLAALADGLAGERTPVWAGYASYQRGDRFLGGGV
jgi:hypothetical protein